MARRRCTDIDGNPPPVGNVKSSVTLLHWRRQMWVNSRGRKGAMGYLVLRRRYLLCDETNVNTRSQSMQCHVYITHSQDRA